MTVLQDIVVLGAGMAGTAIAAHLAEHASVRLLEMEGQPGYHSTGRSAAVFFEAYGNEQIRALTRASRSFLFSPPGVFSQELVRPRSMLLIAREGQAAAYRSFLDSSHPSNGIESVSARQALTLFPVLRPDGLLGGLYSENGADIEVHELHQGYLRLFQSRGGTLVVNAKATGLKRSGELWSVITEQETYTAKILVNATGAWAGVVGELAGAWNIGMSPLKRTACLIGSPMGHRTERWPMLVDIEEQFYLKPDAGALLLSPADETPSAPCDAQVDDLDVAVAVDRIEQATTLDIRRVTHQWAGLRSFTQDRSPVVGFDPGASNFFWYAALGGYGIQTAPALSKVAAALALNLPVDGSFIDAGISPDALSPRRFSAINRTHHFSQSS
jgi:D-arginine dehydrogenase